MQSHDGANILDPYMQYGQ